ncbi:MAG: hypothetical protein OHK0022_08280 [Roseiflexaceae bacterium]
MVTFVDILMLGFVLAPFLLVGVPLLLTWIAPHTSHASPVGEPTGESYDVR